jgi:hypothetical protein
MTQASQLYSAAQLAAPERRGHAMERLRCADEEGQRTEGRRIDVSAGFVWSVVEGGTTEQK